MPTRRIDDGKWKDQICLHPEHNPPNMLYIPGGETWEQICPACGRKTLMSSPIVDC